MGSVHSHASASKAQSPSCRRHVLNGGSLGASASGSLRAHHYHHCHRRMPPTASRQAGRQAGKQARRQCVRDSILQRVQSRFVSSSSQRSLPRRPRLRSSIDYCSPCSASSTKGRSASSRLLSPDLHLGGSQRARRARVPEYAAPHLSPLLPGVIVRDNRHTSQPSTTKTRHCTPHSPSHLTTPAWLAYHHRPPTTTASPCTASS